MPEIREVTILEVAQGAISEKINADSVYSWEESFDFRAGSYSGYNWYREKLGELNAEAFREQIDFSDCEGVIGSVVANRLAKAYWENASKAICFSDNKSFSTHSHF